MSFDKSLELSFHGWMDGSIDKLDYGVKSSSKDTRGLTNRKHITKSKLPWSSTTLLQLSKALSPILVVMLIEIR